MTQRNGHIVSTLVWDTTFDDKALGVDLQNRISHWSNFVMPGELDYVFKQACPEGMSLSISSLEVDLGEIAVDDLEQQMKIRLEAALREKLADMLRYPATNRNVKLIEQGMASLESLRYFLINGVMPWNYHGDDLNLLVADLFRKQQLQTVSLLRETGSASTKARKRIAWQFDEQNFNETLRGFEPVSHEQINGLSGEMVRLQYKEQFVRSSVADLGKEIRLWILNYLLSDRGTIFNKVAFMKGILEQMAQRHNIDYIELLALVEKAIDKPSLTFHVQGEFMIVINMLSQQYRSAESYMGSRYAQLLDLCLPATNQKNQTLYTDPREAIDRFVEAEYDDFNALLTALPARVSYWLKHQNQLDDRFISVFMHACARLWPSPAVQLATYFAQLPNGAIPYISRQTARAIGVSCLLTYKGNADEHSFLDYFVEQAARATGKTRAAITRKLCAALVSLNPPEIKPDNILKLIASATEAGGVDLMASPLTILIQNLNKYYLQVFAKGQDRALLILLRRDLANLITWNARAVLQLLRGFKHKTTLLQTIPLLGDEALITKLLEADKGTVHKAIVTLNIAISSLNQLASRAETALLRRTAYRMALKALVIYPGISLQLFLKELMRQAESSGRFGKSLLAALEVKLALKQMHASTGAEDLKTGVVNRHNESLTLIYQQVLDIKIPLAVILDNLYKHRIGDVLTTRIRHDDELCSLIFNRFFNNGDRKVRQMIGATRNKVIESNPGFSKKLVEQTLGYLFWQCFISKTWHQQGFNGLKTGFAAAVAYRYPTAKPYTVNPNKHQYSAEVYAAIGFQTLTPADRQELVVEIKRTIAAGKKTIIWLGRQVDFTDLLSQIIASKQSHDDLFDLPVLSYQEIVQLMHIVNLEGLLKRLKNNSTISKERIGDVMLINMLCNAPGSRFSGEAALVSVFRQILLINKSRGYWKRSLDRLVKQLFPSMASGTLLSASIVSKFNAGGFVASAGIRKLILALVPQQRQNVERLNGEKLNLAEPVQPIDHTASIPMRKHQQDANGYPSQPKNRDGVHGRKAFYWYRQTDNSNASALQLRMVAANQASFSIPHWYKPGNGFITAISGSTVNAMNVSGPVKPHWYKPGADQIHQEPIIEAASLEIPNPATNNLHLLDIDRRSQMCVGDAINAHQKGITNQLLKQIIDTAHIPSWFNPSPDYSAGMLVTEIVSKYPDTLINMIRASSLSLTEVGQISDVLPFEKLLAILSGRNNAVKALATQIERLYTALGRLSSDGVTGQQMQLLVYRKLLLACKSSNYTLLAASRIWNELAWDISVNFNVNKDKFIQTAAVELQALAPAYRLALGQLISLNKQKNIPAGFQQYLPGNKSNLPTGKSEKPLVTAIPVRNAGVVLLSEYVPTLFRLMETLDGRNFMSPAKQLDAVHILQYAVTGMMETSEVYLPLNKIMCGLRLDDAVADGVSLTSTQQELINGMIMNLVGQWTVIGKTSVDGFRGNWLVRDGVLSETEERCELVVESRPYDILINKFPFSYSIIKYQWMDKPLHVKWKI